MENKPTLVNTSLVYDSGKNLNGNVAVSFSFWQENNDYMYYKNYHSIFHTGILLR